jgi:hypothetical protein
MQAIKRQCLLINHARLVLKGLKYGIEFMGWYDYNVIERNNERDASYCFQISHER